MAKYNYECKKNIVEEYLTGEVGYRALTKKYEIKTKRSIQQWVKAYQTFGDEGLMRSRKNKSYIFEFKFSVVNYI